MNFRKSFSLALYNILYDKKRSILTMLGIIVGVAAVIILISLMNGMTNMIMDAFDDIGTTTITVSVTARGGNRVVDEEDMYAIRDENKDLIEYISPTVSLNRSMVKGSAGTDSINVNVTGVNEEYDEIKNLNVTNGTFLSYMDMESLSKKCVIGTYVQKELFGGMNAVGQNIKINGTPYAIIGVLEEKAGSTSNGSDAVIYIPYTTAFRTSSSASINSYTFDAKSEDVASDASAVIETKLLELLGDDEYFTVTSMNEIIDIATDMIDKMEILLVCIAGISLLVGGIGIMNIMLVSVTERTREIGIRKSLGAKSRVILAQFVIEAGMVSGIGGIIGIILGSVVAIVGGNLLGLTATPTIGSILIAFGVSVGIGITFGYLPAKNAAKLNPIDALRYD